MAKVYAELIRKGLKTMENVPKTLQAEVQELLKNEQLFLLSGQNFLPEGGVHNGGSICNPDCQRQKDNRSGTGTFKGSSTGNS